MSEERYKQIKDSIELQSLVKKQMGVEDELLQEEIELLKAYEKLQQENQELKKKYENAIADYETTMFEKKQLNRLVNSCQEEIRRLKKQVKEYKATNKILSHELTKDKVLQQDYLTTCCGIPIGDIPKLITQQKEFINYLNSYIDLLNDKPDMLEETQKDILEEILQKYKSIIGDDK